MEEPDAIVKRVTALWLDSVAGRHAEKRVRNDHVASMGKILPYHVAGVRIDCTAPALVIVELGYPTFEHNIISHMHRVKPGHLKQS